MEAGSLSLPSPAKLSLTVGTYHGAALPAATGGVGPYSYSLTCAGGQLPSGMGFAPATRVFAGTPDARFRDSCTYAATDSSQPAVTVSRAVEVEVSGRAVTPLSLPSPAKLNLTVATYHGAALPAAAGGVQPYTYSFTCAGGQLPSGMGFAPATRVFAGTPDTRFRDSCTYAATDSSQPAVTVSRAVEVEVSDRAVTPLSLPSPARLGLTVGTYHGAVLPAATGGIGPYTYSFTCAGGQLPSGMGFAPATRVLAGTPDARFRDSCTYAATDSSQPAVTVARAVEVEVSGLTVTLSLPSPAKLSLIVGTYHGAALPAATGGVQPYTYSFTCAGGQLPSGMGFAPATRVFAGTPDARFRDSCTYAATDSSQPSMTVSRAVEIEVSGRAVTPLSLPSPAKLSLTVATYHGAALPAATGGVQPYTYSFTCAGGQLPSGMGFAPATRVFAGTPDAPFRDSCTYAATDSSQPAVTVSRAVEVEVSDRAVTPLSLPSPAKLTLTVGTYHGAALPAASGGIGPYTYSFTCAGGQLPSGMGFAPATRVLAGTPDARFRDSCTYAAMDSSQPAVTISRAVEVEVSGRAVIPLSIPEDFVPNSPRDAVVFLRMERRARVTFKAATGGVQPYTYELLGCELPSGLRFSPDARTLTGTPLEAYRGPDCTYQVTDSASPPASVSRDFELIVDPLDRGTWRFRARTVEPGGPCALRLPGRSTPVAILPHAQGGEVDRAAYELTDFPNDRILSFDEGTRQLTYVHPPADPILGTPNTYRYLVGTEPSVDAANAEDALCLDIQYNPGGDICPDPSGDLEPGDFIFIQLQVRDDAYWDENVGEYRCPDTTAPAPRSAARSESVSNPVHTALAPIHARRAVDVAHTAVRDRVRRWSPDDPRGLGAIDPAIGLASLSGRTEGFDYTGSSESLSAGAELGAGSWQAGLVASFARTDLHYRAEADLSARGYLAGEHDTEILSLHPFAAWHASSGGHLWASLGAGMGELRHRDDLGFPSWSRSDVRLLAYDVGASVPVADVLSGELQAEAGIESFALEIEGGGNVSPSLPTMRGVDYRAGLTWSAPLPGDPSISMAYKQLTGDGPEGGALEAQGSLSVAGVFDPRISVKGSAEASLGLGNYDQNLWGLGVGLRFARDDLRRGFGLDLDTRLMSLVNERASDVSIRGEAGYGVWGGPFFGTVRPYVGVVHRSGDRSFRQTLGIDLRETASSTAKVEVNDHARDRLRAIMFTFRRRF